MALPISPGEIFEVAKWAFDLWKSCKAAKGEFEQVSKEVYEMRTVVQIVHLDCQSPSSIINHIDDDRKTIRRKLGVYIQNCKQALFETEALLERYSKMSILERFRWGLGGHTDVADVVSKLSSFTTQLNTFVNTLAFKGIGKMNANLLGGFATILRGIDRIEEALEKSDGDEKVAVKEVMQDISRTGVSHEVATKYHDIIEGYAREVSLNQNLLPTSRAQTPDSSRGRDPDPNFVSVTPAAPRRGSVNSSPNGQKAKNKKGPVLGRSGGKKPDYNLECWLIQAKSAEALLLSFQFLEKEKQKRGQCKLREMANQFKASSQAFQLANDHELVNWVLQDRKRQEKNNDFEWYPHAGNIERKGSLSLGLGVEEQAMIIIKRQMTPEARRKADEKKLAAAKRAAAEKANPGKEEAEEAEEGKTKGKGGGQANKKKLAAAKTAAAEKVQPGKESNERRTEGKGAQQANEKKSAAAKTAAADKAKPEKEEPNDGKGAKQANEKQSATAKTAAAERAMPGKEEPKEEKAKGKGLKQANEKKSAAAEKVKPRKEEPKEGKTKGKGAKQTNETKSATAETAAAKKAKPGKNEPKEGKTKEKSTEQAKGQKLAAAETAATEKAKPGKEEPKEGKTNGKDAKKTNENKSATAETAAAEKATSEKGEPKEGKTKGKGAEQASETKSAAAEKAKPERGEPKEGKAKGKGTEHANEKKSTGAEKANPKKEQPKEGKGPGAKSPK